MYLTWIQRTEYGHGEVDEQQRQKLGFVAKYAEITVYLILKYNARSWWKVVKVTFIKNHIQKILIKEKPINKTKGKQTWSITIMSRLIVIESKQE